MNAIDRPIIIKSKHPGPPIENTPGLLCKYLLLRAINPFQFTLSTIEGLDKSDKCTGIITEKSI